MNTEVNFIPIEGYGQLYSVSEFGQIINEETGKELHPGPATGGVYRVNLLGQDGKRKAVTLKLLVAEAFVPFSHPGHESVVCLDGDESNCSAWNLVWRTRSFAWRYTNQRNEPFIVPEVGPIGEVGPIVDVETGDEYENIHDAAETHGLLYRDIWRNINGAQDVVPPVMMRFRRQRHLSLVR